MKKSLTDIFAKVSISVETNAHQNGKTDWLDPVMDKEYK